MLIGIGAGGLLLLAAGGFFAWQSFSTPAAAPPAAKGTPPKPAAATPAPTAPGTSPKTSTTPAPNLAHIPASAIDKANAAVAAHTNGVQATNEITTPATPSAAPTEPARPVVKPVPVGQGTVTTEIAPGVSTSSQITSAAEASPAVRAFVANLKISGFVSGPSPRALINGRLVHVGETIDSNLGVTFDGVKGDQLIFKDRAGATVHRRY